MGRARRWWQQRMREWTRAAFMRWGDLSVFYRPRLEAVIHPRDLKTLGEALGVVLTEPERRALACVARHEADFSTSRYHPELTPAELSGRHVRWLEIADALHPDPFSEASRTTFTFWFRTVPDDPTTGKDPDRG